MVKVRRLVASAVSGAAALSFFAPAATSVPAASKTTAAAAVQWLTGQQQSDGGFELAGFPGFETRDAALAIAENGQTGSTWSTTEAVNAVAAVKYHGSGPTPFDALDAYAATITTAGAAAKTIVLSASPFGFDPAAYDPAGNGSPVDLKSLMGCSTTTDATFSNLLYIALAQDLACGAPQPAALTAVRAAQQAKGGWNFLGDPNGTDFDADTTALAVEALVAGGADGADPAVAGALRFIADNQQSDGAWQSFGADDPNSTALSIVAVTAAGFDVESPCWRDTVDPSKAGTAYASPTVWISSQQLTSPPADAGRIASPNDGFGVNTFATSQSVQGLLQSWLPVTRAAARTCSSSTPTVDTSTPVAGGTVTVSGGGFAASTELTIELHSTPVLLGTTTTDASGNYSAVVTIPVDTAPGAHSLVVSGLDPSGQPRTVSVAITVVAAPVPVPVSPRFTG
jgi:hypothetical protein